MACIVIAKSGVKPPVYAVRRAPAEAIRPFGIAINTVSHHVSQPIHLLPYDGDPLAFAAERILTRHADALPDLDQVVVLLPDTQSAPRLRELLLRGAADRGLSALLGPRIDTLPGWLDSLCIAHTPAVQNVGRDLILMEALQQHRTLFGDADPWRLCESLLQFFDELTRFDVQLPDNVDEFISRIGRGYGTRATTPAHLGREATLVHTLWRAWHQQLHAHGRIDPNSAYILRLRQSLDSIRTNQTIFVLGWYRATSAECAWLQALLKRGQLELILHGAFGSDHYHPDAALTRLTAMLHIAPHATKSTDALSLFIDATYAYRDNPLSERARNFRRGTGADSPARNRLMSFHAEDAEQEARAIDLQVRRWLLEGMASIGIVTEDRRLARRVRALLERAEIVLDDTGGWALSTTSAATVIERWLQTVEEDFAHQPLLDLLKSPFLLPLDDADGFRAAVYRLERDIVLHENVARGLARYRRHLRFRARRLKWSAPATARIAQLLDHLAHAAAPLQALFGGRPHLPQRYLDALDFSLDALELRRTLAADAAGFRVLQQLQQLRAATDQRQVRMNWSEFRGWLGRALERASFRPNTANSAVQLLTLEQSHLCRFDALIIAGAEISHLPGSGTPSPYFNDAVRGELKLPSWHETLTERFYHFRRLLSSSNRVLITCHRQQDGDEVVVSPWLEALETFHNSAFGCGLDDAGLTHLLSASDTDVCTFDEAELPHPMPYPRPQVAADKLPHAVSASAHQRLVDCPYQFFAADCLQLKPVDEIREVLEKSDYGQRVHRCLQAFHATVDGLPGPFSEPLTAENRARAIDCLQAIAHAQFAKDLEDNFMHRGWLKRWLSLIPAYIDWQIERQRHWSVVAVESACEQTIGPTWRLKGRLDRVDANGSGQHAVIDYKTGATPNADMVMQGEAVQLASYAILHGSTTQVEYVRLDGEHVESASMLDGTELSELRDRVRRRLASVLDEAAAGAALPAWGDEQVCKHCPMSGLCRREAWLESAQAAP